MKNLACQIVCYTSLFLIIFSCEEATEADMYPKLPSGNEHSLTNPSPSSDKTIWFAFNKKKLPNGKYKVGTNPKTGSKLFITLKNNEVVQVHIQTINGFVIELDPMPRKDGINPAEFMCVDPNAFKIFEGRPDTTHSSRLLQKYTIYVVPKDCDPASNVMLIPIHRDY